MTGGHFGLAAGAKAGAPRLPLWVLLVSTYLLDFVFIILVAAGVESFAPLDPAKPSYGNVVIQAYYTHSLVGALALSAIAGLLASLKWGRRNGWVVAGVAFSHWVLDLVMHRPDLPLLPGNAGNLPFLGLGLWNYPTLAALLELAIVLGGAAFYLRSALKLPASSGGGQRRRALTAGLTTGTLLLLLLAADVFGM